MNKRIKWSLVVVIAVAAVSLYMIVTRSSHFGGDMGGGFYFGKACRSQTEALFNDALRVVGDRLPALNI